MSSLYSNEPPQSPDLNPTEHLWDVIMSIRITISKECFHHLVESVPRTIKTVLKAKKIKPGARIKKFKVSWTPLKKRFNRKNLSDSVHLWSLFLEEEENSSLSANWSHFFHYQGQKTPGFERAQDVQFSLSKLGSYTHSKTKVQAFNGQQLAISILSLPRNGQVYFHHFTDLQTNTASWHFPSSVWVHTTSCQKQTLSVCPAADDSDRFNFLNQCSRSGNSLQTKTPNGKLLQRG